MKYINTSMKEIVRHNVRRSGFRDVVICDFRVDTLERHSVRLAISIVVINARFVGEQTLLFVFVHGDWT